MTIDDTALMILAVLPAIMGAAFLFIVVAGAID